MIGSKIQYPGIRGNNFYCIIILSEFNKPKPFTITHKITSMLNGGVSANAAKATGNFCTAIDCWQIFSFLQEAKKNIAETAKKIVC